MKTDYLIVGQGISGTLLSWQLLQTGKKVLVIDDAQPITATKVASGLINPVTGKKHVTTWLAETLIPFAHQSYQQLGALLGPTFIRTHDLLNFHPTAEAAGLFEARESEDDTYLYHVNTPGAYTGQFHFSFGIGGVSLCYLVDTSLLLQSWRAHLVANDALLEEHFSWDACRIETDRVLYKNIEAAKIIFCAGAADLDNPYFTRLNFQLNKGEAIIAQIPGLSLDYIYKHGPLSLVPWHSSDAFWIGSTFDREYTDALPTPSFRRLVENTLHSWLKLPYTILDHLAAIRPATGGQKPFIGLHPVHPAVGIFNGMGSKGCSLAPYFAHQFTRHLLDGTPLHPEADIQRFARILSR